MRKKLEPIHIERNVIFLQSRDGMLDIYFGFMLGAAGLNGIFSYFGWDIPWYIRFLILIMLVPVLLGKFLITTPRIGYIKIKPVKGGRLGILRIFLIICMILTLFMLTLSIFNIRGIHNQTLGISPVLMFGILILIMSFVAWLIGLYSLFFVGLVSGFGFFLADPLGLEMILGYPADLFIFCIPGLLIVLFGIYRLGKFLKLHPADNLNADYENE